ncbi:MAG: hypothetical protein KJZ59_05405, partial [Pararhodobacter sp.]|nr:hypothetical protein [Pararhodobacter sp.]
MSARNPSESDARAPLPQLVRRFPLAARIAELLAVIALYAAGIVAVDRLTGQSGVLVTVYVIFAMPLVLSVGLRLYRTLERRVTHRRDEGPLGHAG